MTKTVAAVLACLAFGGLLGASLVELDPAPLRIAPLVALHLDQSGVAHPVTAVLLNFRGYDTLLEVAVLLVALAGVLACANRPERASIPAPDDPILPTLARLAAPLMTLVGVYLLWAGAHRPGGAFQAGALLAGTAVLLHLTGLRPAWASPGALLRTGITGGFLLFLAVAAALTLEGAVLQYPPAHAGLLILAIEAGLTVSLGLLLGGLFLFLSGEPPGRAPP
jgi:multisubunit Na+/H+ antiporter MnhB subunit